jgi:hypothetical protein
MNTNCNPVNTKSDPIASFHVADLASQSGFDSDYHSRFVDSASDPESIAVVFTMPFSGDSFKVLISGAALKGYVGNKARDATVATYAEAIKKLLGKPSGSKTELALSASATWRPTEGKRVAEYFGLFAERSKRDTDRHLDVWRLAPLWLACSESTGPESGCDDSLTELVRSVCHYPKLRYAAKLAERLGNLLEISREEQPEQAPPALASVKSLIAFLATYPELAYPSVVLTQEGNVRIQWRRGRDEHLAVEFLGDGDVRFVIFAPDPKHPYKTIRASGSATVDSVMRLAEPYGVLRWASEQPTEEEAK